MIGLPSRNVSRETLIALTRYVDLLSKWNQRINLIGKQTEPQIWQRHIDDSLQLLDAIPASVKTAIDLGSGAGLPGLVVAIARPALTVTLVEKDQRKAAFLQHITQQLDLKNTRLLCMDIAQITGSFELVMARALARLTDLCAFAHPLLAGNAYCLFPKGKDFASEVEEAHRAWQFESIAVPSQTHQGSCIISLSKLMPKDKII